MYSSSNMIQKLQNDCLSIHRVQKKTFQTHQCEHSVHCKVCFLVCFIASSRSGPQQIEINSSIPPLFLLSFGSPSGKFICEIVKERDFGRRVTYAMIITNTKDNFNEDEWESCVPKSCRKICPTRLNNHIPELHTF